MKRVIACLMAVVLAAVTGCQARAEQLRPALAEDGEIYFYMEPFPPGADRLSFSLEGIYAVAGDGTLVPLGLRMARFSFKFDSRQRLAAWGVLPPGRYKGLAFKVRNASLERAEGGKADLLVPGKPVREDFPFSVEQKQAAVIAADLVSDNAVKAGFSFTPAFDMKIPVKPVDALLGYVVNYGSNDVTIFDKAAMEVTGVIPTGPGPVSMVLDRELKRGYISISGEDTIDVIDMVSGSIIRRIRLNPGDDPRELALTPDNKTLLCINSGSDTVSVIDPVSYIETSRIKVGTQPLTISLDRAGGRAYVFNYFSNTVSIIDIPSGTVVATVTTDLTPLRGEFSRNGDKFYVINEGSPYLTAIDPATLSIVKRQFAGMGMRAIKVDPHTDLIYIGKEGDPNIEVYNPFTLMPEDYIKGGRDVSFMAIDGDENNLCVTDPGENALLFINLASRETASKIDVGEDPVWVTMVGER